MLGNKQGNCFGKPVTRLVFYVHIIVSISKVDSHQNIATFEKTINIYTDLHKRLERNVDNDFSPMPNGTFTKDNFTVKGNVISEEAENNTTTNLSFTTETIELKNNDKTENAKKIELKKDTRDFNANTSESGVVDANSNIKEEVTEKGCSRDIKTLTYVKSRTDGIVRPVANLTSEMHFKNTTFKLKGEIKETSPLFGRINNKFITVAIYVNTTGQSCTVHLGSLYATSFVLDKSKNKLSKDNNQAKRIIYQLNGILWPFDGDDSVARKRFVQNKIDEMGFQVDHSNRSEYFIKEFVNGFDLDPILRTNSCLACFCDIYRENKTEETDSEEESLICFSSIITEEQSRILYPEYYNSDKEVIEEDRHIRKGCYRDNERLKYHHSRNDRLLRPVGNLTSAMQLKWIQFNSSGQLNKDSPLYGRINSDNITVVLFVNETGFNCVMHLGSFYATSFLRHNSFDKLSGDNKQAKEILTGLDNVMWPFNIDEPGVRKEFVETKILELGYVADTSNESEYFIKEFVNGFDFDPKLKSETCVACFCSIYRQNQTQEADSFEESLICFSPVIDDKQSKILYADYFAEAYYTDISSYTMIISTVFLFITLIIYVITPKLRKIVYGQCICLYLASMFVSYTCSYVTTLFTEKLGKFCFPLGFMIQFSWLTNFTWQTILCLDILMAFRKVKPLVSSSKEESQRKLIYYCIYAYGLPAVITLITMLLQFGPFLENSQWKPNMNKHCFFPKRGDKKVRWLYFSGPYGAMILVNFLMFIVTAILIARYSRASAKRFNRTSFRKSNTAKQDKDMIRAHITLFFVMGTNWIFELIIMIDMDTVPPNTIFWRILDTLNNSIGIVLFLVLICKRQVWTIMTEKYEKCSKKFKAEYLGERQASLNSGSASTQLSSLNNNSANVSQEESCSKV